MGEALIPFYAMLDTRNAIWCPRSVWRRRNSMSEDGRMMLERVHACDETCYFIHKLGWDEEVRTGCLKSRFCKSFRHLSLLNILFIAFNLRIDVRFFFFQHSVYIITAKLKTRESSSLKREWFQWFQYENMLEKHGLEDGMNGIFFVKQTWDEKVLLRETYETNSVMFHHGK